LLIKLVIETSLHYDAPSEEHQTIVTHQYTTSTRQPSFTDLIYKSDYCRMERRRYKRNQNF